MSQIIKDQLLQKAIKNEMHNVYLVEPNRSCTNNEVLNWTTDFLQKFLSHSGIKAKIENHQDVLIITPDDKKKYYGQESVEEIFKFLNYDASELKRKILIITNADKLSEISANKLLKTFEEPPIPLTIFLLNPLLFEVIPTVASRSIHLNIKFASDTAEKFELEWPISFADFSAKLAAGEFTQHQVASHILARVEEENIATASVNEIQQQLTDLDRDILYNGPLQGRAFRLFSCLEELSK